MSKIKREMTDEELEMYARAILEKTVYSKDLLGEIFPLLEDYFIGDFELTKDCIIWRMLNNQNFKITIEEI